VEIGGHATIGWSSRRLVLLLVLGVLGIGAPSAARAVDGRIPINQDRAVAGGVTPGDTAGFPVTIATAGTYVLTGPLTVSAANTNAILVTADDVSIDLNGFKVAGPVSCSGTPVTSCTSTGAGDGIGGSQTGVIVRNGTVRGFANNGIGISGRALIENVTVFQNAADGINVGNDSVVRGCIAVQNGDDGIAGTNAVVVEHSQSHHNLDDGIHLANSGTVRGNVVRGNGDDGIYVNASAVENNALYLNGGDGIHTTSASLVRGNSVRGSTANGLNLNGHSGYTQNSMDANGTDVTGGVKMFNNNNCSGSLCP
jgi:hypothetical protein